MGKAGSSRVWFVRRIMVFGFRTVRRLLVFSGALFLVLAVALSAQPTLFLPADLCVAVSYEPPHYVGNGQLPPRSRKTGWSRWREVPGLKDPWGSIYRKRNLVGTDVVELRSAGPNGIPFDADDIVLDQALLASALVTVLRALTGIMVVLGGNLLWFGLLVQLRPTRVYRTIDLLVSACEALASGASTVVAFHLSDRIRDAAIQLGEPGLIPKQWSVGLTTAVLAGFVLHLLREEPPVAEAASGPGSGGADGGAAEAASGPG